MSLPPSKAESAAVADAACEAPVPGLAALSREREPARDLWAGIESRIAAPQRKAARHRQASLWPYGLAASVAAALITGLLLRSPQGVISQPREQAGINTEFSPEPARLATARHRPDDHRQGEPRTGDSAPRGQRTLRSESLDNAPALVAERAGARDSGLMKATYASGGHQGAQAQQAILRANLKLARQAEREVRRALKADPESQSLQGLLASTQQQRERLTTLLIHDPG